VPRYGATRDGDDLEDCRSSARKMRWFAGKIAEMNDRCTFDSRCEGAGGGYGRFAGIACCVA